MEAKGRNAKPNEEKNDYKLFSDRHKCIFLKNFIVCLIDDNDIN